MGDRISFESHLSSVIKSVSNSITGNTINWLQNQLLSSRSLSKPYISNNFEEYLNKLTLNKDVSVEVLSLYIRLKSVYDWKSLERVVKIVNNFCIKNIDISDFTKILHEVNLLLIWDDSKSYASKKNSIVNRLSKGDLSLNKIDNLLVEIDKIIGNSRPSREYELSFIRNHPDVFELPMSEDRSVTIDLKLSKDIIWSDTDLNNVVLLNKEDYNNKNNCEKLRLIVVSIHDNFIIKNKDIEPPIKYIVENLFIDNQSMTKSDIKLLDYPPDGQSRLIEIKFKSWNKPDFLFEIFKPLSNTKCHLCITKYSNKWGIINKILVQNITTKLSNMGYLIEDLILNLRGIMFDDHIFVYSKDINFTWSDTGFAGKDRIAVKYEVKPGATLYKFNVNAKKFEIYNEN